MTIYHKITEGLHAAEYLLSELDPGFCREEGVLAAGNDLDAGTVLGQVTAGEQYTRLDPAAADGSEVAVAVLFAPKDATDADSPCVVTARDSKVQGVLLTWPDGITAEQKAAAIAELKQQRIFVR